MWTRGIKLLSLSSPELGVGVVLAVDGEYLDAFFPDANRQIRFSLRYSRLHPIELQPGDAVVFEDGRIGRIRQIRGGRALLVDGSRANLAELWPHIESPTLVDRLAASEVDPLLDVLNRVDGQRILNLRQRLRAATLVGARVEVVPHLVATAARILDDENPRWLLAGETGTGRMVAACMVVAERVRNGRAQKTVIVAPHRRALRWVSELYQRFHQVLVHVDEERWREVKERFGFDASPFDIYDFCVVSSGLLASEETLREHLLASDADLVVLDEPHHEFGFIVSSLSIPLIESTPSVLALVGTPAEVGDELLARLVGALVPGTDPDARTAPQATLLSDAGVLVHSEPHPDGTRWTFPDSAPTSSGVEELPADFDEILERFTLDAADRVELEVESRPNDVYYLEYGPQVKVPSLPGLRPGVRYLGTFERSRALEDESLDFFSSGHPLVEALLGELRNSPRGRIGAVRLRRSDAPGFHGLYMVIVEDADDEYAVRAIALLDASGALVPPQDPVVRGRELYAALDMGIELPPERVAELMGRVANHPLLEEFDSHTISQAVLVAVMDRSDP